MRVQPIENMEDTWDKVGDSKSEKMEQFRYTESVVDAVELVYNEGRLTTIDSIVASRARDVGVESVRPARIEVRKIEERIEGGAGRVIET